MAKIIKLPSRRGQLVPVHEAVSKVNMHALALNKRRYMDAAIVEGRRAIALSPGSKELWCNLGTFYWKKRIYDLHRQGASARSRVLPCFPQQSSDLRELGAVGQG